MTLLGACPADDWGLLDALPGQLRAPRRLLTTEPAADEAWIWLEDVDGTPGASWPVTDYASVAFDVGTTQGAYPGGAAPLPTGEWLSHDWLRGWVDVLARHVDLVDDGTTVAVDWSQVGIGALGQDLDQLTLDPVWMPVLPGGDIGKIERQVLPSYLAGLQSSGLEVSAERLEDWYAAAAAARYGPMLTMYAAQLAEPDRVASLERRHGRPIEAISADKGRVIERALTLGERVLGL